MFDTVYPSFCTYFGWVLNKYPTINWGSLFRIFGRHGHKIEAGPKVEGSGWAMASVRVDHTLKTVFL